MDSYYTSIVDARINHNILPIFVISRAQRPLDHARGRRGNQHEPSRSTAFRSSEVPKTASLNHNKKLTYHSETARCAYVLRHKELQKVTHSSED